MIEATESPNRARPQHVDLFIHMDRYLEFEALSREHGGFPTRRLWNGVYNSVQYYFPKSAEDATRFEAAASAMDPRDSRRTA